MSNGDDGFDEKVETLKGLLEAFEGMNGGGRQAPGADSDDKRLANAEPLETITADTFVGKPAPFRPWLVRELIPSRNVTDISGEGGLGKTLLAMQLAYAVTSGTEWIGRRVEETGAAIFMSCEEEHDEFHRRSNPIAEAAGVSGGEVAKMHLLDMTIAPSTELAAATAGSRGAFGLTDLYFRVEKTVGNIRPKLLILDTRTDVFAGNENDRAQARMFVRSLRKLCFRYDTTVVMLSHPSLTGTNTGTGTSGTTGWNNSVRSRLYLERRYASNGKGEKAEPDRRRRVLKRMKANYGADTGEEGIFLTMSGEGVLIADALGQAALDRAALEQAVEKRFLELLVSYEQSGRHVSEAEGKYNAGRLFHETDGRYSPKLYSAAMERLFTAKKIRSVQFSAKSRGMTQIVLAEPAEGV